MPNLGFETHKGLENNTRQQNKEGGRKEGERTWCGGGEARLSDANEVICPWPRCLLRGACIAIW